MTFTVNIPSFRCNVRDRFLGDGTGSSQAYLIACTSIPNRPLFFTAHLFTGAIWSRLPIHALWSDFFDHGIGQPDELTLDQAQPYSCLGGDIQYIEYQHLKNYRVKLDSGQSGTYLFTIDIIGQGLAEDPEQHKTHNICVLDNGNLVAFPNNKLLFLDEYFTDGQTFPKYKRQSQYWTCE